MCTGRREKLILQRKRSLMSQHAVAAVIGISQASYSLIENGYKNPGPEEAAQLTTMFGLPNDYFGDLETEQEEQPSFQSHLNRIPPSSLPQSSGPKSL